MDRLVDAVAILVFIILHQIPRSDVQGLRRLAAFANVRCRDVDANTAIARFPVVAIVINFQHWVDGGDFASLAVDVKFAIGIRAYLAHQIVEASV